MSNELKIEAGKYYRLRSGLRVYVAATNKPGPYPIVAWHDSGVVEQYIQSGKYYQSGDEHGSDIISEWVEPERIPWEHLPKWCRWWAKDADGSERGYSGPPDPQAGYWYAGAGEQQFGFARLPQNLHSNYNGDWRNSLRERPEGV